MEYSFGSNEFFYLFKAAYEEQDTDAIGELLWPLVCKASQQLFRKECFWGYSLSDKEDAQQDAMLYVLKKIEAFLKNPGNDPSSSEDIRYSPGQKEKFFYKLVEYGLLHSFRDVYKDANIISLDAYRNQEEGRTVEETLIVSDKWAPDGRLEEKSALEEALLAFFSLPNNPETLASIGFLIISEQMSGDSLSLEEYADFINGKTTDMLVMRIEELLKPFRLHCDVLSPLKKRLGEHSGAFRFSAITPSKLANRKNSIISKLSILRKESETAIGFGKKERGGKPNE